MNTHNGHVASCLCCKRLSGWDAYPGYSEYTPEEPGGIVCTANMVEFDFDNMMRTLRLMHDTAPECPAFEERED